MESKELSYIVSHTHTNRCPSSGKKSKGHKIKKQFKSKYQS